ncbi:unnamed protein product [Brassica oleracea var. botrytis]
MSSLGLSISDLELSLSLFEVCVKPSSLFSELSLTSSLFSELSLTSSLSRALSHELSLSSSLSRALFLELSLLRALLRGLCKAVAPLNSLSRDPLKLTLSGSQVSQVQTLPKLRPSLVAGSLKFKPSQAQPLFSKVFFCI